MKKTALIMAGGRGERFWPKSRKSLPKQFLSLTGDGRTMIQLTVERLMPLVALEDIYIVTNREYKDIVLEQIKGIPAKNVLCEPSSKNTAPCIGFGAMYIEKLYNDAVMYVLPSDHQIKFTQIFLSALSDASDIAVKNSNLVTIGINPDYPETGYGYIKFNPGITDGRAYMVDSFVEKPGIDLAKEYIASEEYLWNSGMFTWKVSSILKSIKEFMPDTYERLKTIQASMDNVDSEKVIEKEYSLIEAKSIDYGIMEKANNIYVVPGSFGWDDVGSWLALERLQKSNEFGNVVTGDVISVNTENCIIQGEDKLIATVGLRDAIVVDTKDAILICNKDNAGDIKKVIENLKICNRNEFI
ncbi:hypothetical protein HMPREF9333_00342 [Johnsonella ignava ATCC 51276]|uniref:mannose-1-phosphate guanylyltransferase n=1 Tax=Johnsonella ignava ATCC 51276 TaxID=679200 RepID=G5GFK3_9FIRM|nr:mannose-1-phosphate guanylyltransferase [Johnsonella ignava]EHI56480.1 hypothetical protein HMPREF9333_00342 [Johnsonella ignava ATCC 51276]